MKPSIGIDKKDLSKVADILHILLADEVLLFYKTKNFHWNVTGPHFISFHKLFDEQAEKLVETIDEVAERIRALGEPVKATLTHHLKKSNLKEQEKHLPALDYVAELLSDHETIIKFIRENLEKIDNTGDAGTTDFVTAIMEAHEKECYFLRSHLE